MIVAPGATLSTPIPLPLDRADDPAHVGAVAVAVLRRRVVLHEVVALPDVPRQVRVVGLHARVHDGHHRARAGGDRVRGVRLDQVEVPLLAPARVGSARGGGEEEQQQDDQSEAHRKGVTRNPLYAITYVRMEVATHVGSRVRALREGMDL